RKQERMSSPGSSLPPSPLYLPWCASLARLLRCTRSTRRPSGDRMYPKVARIGVYGMEMYSARTREIASVDVQFLFTVRRWPEQGRQRLDRCTNIRRMGENLGLVRLTGNTGANGQRIGAQAHAQPGAPLIERVNWLDLIVSRLFQGIRYL